MTNADRTGVLVLACSCALTLASCATKGDVDMTPTANLAADAHVGRSLTPDSLHIADITGHFKPNETIQVVVDVPNGIDGSMEARWFYNDTESIGNETREMTRGYNVYHFHMDPPAAGFRPGKYRLDVFINGKVADTEKFEVEPA